MLKVEFVGKVYIRFAIEQVSKVKVGTLKMDGVDLKIAPVQASISIVVVDLAFARRVFGTLDGEGQPAILRRTFDTHTAANRRALAPLVRLCFVGVVRVDPLRYDHG